MNASYVSPEERQTYRPDIDGLRAVAIVGVVFFHAGLKIFSSGFVGVDIFFVVSGYLIGGIILRDIAQGSFSFVRFYARRARRILPMLFLVVTVLSIAGYTLFDAREFKDVGVTGLLALVGASNVNFWQFQDYFASDSRLRTLLMTWSLGVEEQFYIVFPLVLLAVLRVARSWIVPVIAALLLASFAVNLFWTETSPAAAFYLLPGRMWELGTGALLAAVEARGPGLGVTRLAPGLQNLVAPVALVALVLAITLFDEHTPFPGMAALLPVVATAGLIACPQSWVNRRVLARQPFPFIGLVSYSWYLWHWPMISVLRVITPDEVPTRVLVGVAVLSFVPAVVSWRLVERPFRRARLSPPMVLSRYAMALVIVAAVPLTIRVTDGLPQRLPPKARHLEHIATNWPTNTCLVLTGDSLDNDPSCRVLPPDRPVVAVFGDSHAWALKLELARQAAEQGFGYEFFTRSACPPLTGVTVRSSASPAFAEDCTAFKARALKEILRDPWVSTVVLAGYWYAPVERGADVAYVPDADSPQPGGSSQSDHAAALDRLGLLKDGLTRTVDDLVRADKHVIIMQDPPSWRFDPMRTSIADAIPARRWLVELITPNLAGARFGTEPRDRVARHRRIRAAIDAIAAGHSNVRVFDPFSSFCDGSTCRFDDGDPLYFDRNHLSPYGAKVALRGFSFEQRDVR